MKFEDFIKDKVEQHQEVYDPTAWTKLSSKMNVSPKGIHPTTTTLKWWIAASITAIALVSGFVFMNKQTNSTKEKTITVSEKEQKTKETNNAANSIENKQIQPKTTNVSTTDIKINPATTSKVITPENKIHSNQDVANNDKISTNIAEDNSKISTNNKEIKNIELIALAIPIKICKGDNLAITNKNSETLILKSKTSSLKVGAKQMISTENLSVGNYAVTSTEGKELQRFEIIDTPKLDFVADNLMFDKGLPFIPVKLTNAELDSYNWTLNNQTLGSKKDVLVPAFNKGGVKVKFNGTINGCPVNDTYLVAINEDYNLLAVTAFNIDSRDERNKTFLPSALYERSEAFEMQIIDPKNNEVIFTSRSNSEPWNGIDKRTGELVTPNTRYIWTVRLSEKANYETKAVYQGVVVRVTY